jgi:predicted  nucleic acid-binding Zn-ribbon protein
MAENAVIQIELRGITCSFRVTRLTSADRINHLEDELKAIHTKRDDQVAEVVDLTKAKSKLDATINDMSRKYKHEQKRSSSLLAKLDKPHKEASDKGERVRAVETENGSLRAEVGRVRQSKGHMNR